jgi:hypothetical protein
VEGRAPASPFGSGDAGAPPSTAGPGAGRVVHLQVVPAEVLLRPGEKVTFSLRGLDANGNLVKELTGGHWKKFVPPTAKVRSEMDAEFNEQGELAAKPTARLSAGSWEVTVRDGTSEFKGYMRGRVVAGLPYRQDFESFIPAEQPDGKPGDKFAWPPLPWIGARFKWDIRELGNGQVFAKTLDNMLFQRAFTFLGDPAAKNYTLSADVMSEGNRRNMSNVGVINQRYVVNLVGNWQQLEVVSTQDRRIVVGELEVYSFLADPEAVLIAPYVQPHLQLAPNTSAAAAIFQMRSARKSFAVVANHADHYSGVVSIKDLVEEIVGDLPLW